MNTQEANAERSTPNVQRPMQNVTPLLMLLLVIDKHA
jgi:hypothetical protein